MTIGQWLAERTPRPPELLAERIERALEQCSGADAGQAAESCSAVGEAMLRRFLAEPPNASKREMALDLLTIDALVTYAFEDSDEEPDAIGARAEGVMMRIAGAGSA